MSDFAKMDIFFFVTTCVVVVLAILIALILIRVFRILGHLEHISEELSEEAELVRADIKEVRADLRREGFKWLLMFLPLRRFIQRIFRKNGKQ
jgi:hypothetical protein